VATDLLRRGAPVAAYSAQLIYLAVHVRRPDLVSLLLDHGADARAVEGHIFQATADLDLLRLLLARGASATGVSPNGFPPLVYLARGDKGEHPEKIALLLEHGAEVNARGGPHGRTALHYAAAAGHAAVVRQLLAAGADPGLADHAGQTPRAAARAAGHRFRGL
jgi:ankyrin repeat protein